MTSFQFDSGRDNLFGDIFEGRQAPTPSANSSLLERREWPSLELSLSEFEPDSSAYPPESVEVRNTFIHVASPAGEDADRPVLSCPASKIGWIKDLLEEPPSPSPQPEVPEVVKPKEDLPLPRPVIRLENALEAQGSQPEPWQQPLPVGRSQGTGRAVGVIGDQRGRSQTTYMLPTAFSTGRDTRRAQIVGAIGPSTSVHVGPAPAGPLGPRTMAALKPHGTKELPSVGSAGHAFGTCKPCGFFYAKGCLNGSACSFCHLCDRGEKKRRQKQKKACLKGGA